MLMEEVCVLLFNRFNHSAGSSSSTAGTCLHSRGQLWGLPGPLGLDSGLLGRILASWGFPDCQASSNLLGWIQASWSLLSWILLLGVFRAGFHMDYTWEAHMLSCRASGDYSALKMDEHSQKIRQQKITFVV